MKLLLFISLIPINFGMTLFAWLFVNWWAALFANKEGWLPKWLTWFQTFDNSLDAGLIPDSLSEVQIFGGIERAGFIVILPTDLPIMFLAFLLFPQSGQYKDTKVKPGSLRPNLQEAISTTVAADGILLLNSGGKLGTCMTKTPEHGKPFLGGLNGEYPMFVQSHSTGAGCLVKKNEMVVGYNLVLQRLSPNII